MRVLVTRPDDDAGQTVGLLEKLGHSAVVEPVLNVVFEPDLKLDLSGVRAVLATSRNGVRALVRATDRRDLRILSVGPSTAELARQTGFGDVRDADGDVDDLVRMTTAQLQPDNGVLLHISGRDVAGNLKGALEKSGYRVRRVVGYRAVASEALSADCVTALTRRQIDAVLFFSPRSAGTFASLVRPFDALRLACGEIAAICISERAAEALAPVTFREVRIADRPNQEALLRCLGDVR
ncbi:uroporphyrinogen-III synthase [Minwuia sp.]|uniref:uroporphyrinogen-III synthase n=1 Tax=Minwuia sp. TaxID=2493630 RepID=UPI003A8DD0AD